MDKKLKGIVIKSKNSGEANKAVTILTAEEGKITVFAKSVKKADAKLKFAVELFCFADFELSKAKDRYILTGCELYELFYDLRGNLEKFYLANALIEIFDKVCDEGMNCTKELVFIVKSLEEIVNCKSNIDYLAIKLILESLEVAGYGISDFSCGNCGEKINKDAYFCFDSCAFYCEKCKNEYVKIDKDTFSLLNFCFESEINLLENSQYDNVSSVQCLRFLYKIMNYKLFFSNNSLSCFAKLIK